LTRPTVNIEELQEHSPQLRSLNEWYRQNVDKLGIQTKVFYETKPMNGILVVDEDSSNPGIRDVKPVAISEDYISIAKPEKNDLVYLSTIKFCEEVFTSETKPQFSENIPENFSYRRGAKKFVGREKVIQTLYKQLQLSERIAITSVTGMGGIGKTELALQYAHFHLIQKTYKGGICWLDCRGENVGIQITSFATSQFSLQIPKEEDLQTRIKFCWRNWPPGDVLIIFDDVVDYEDVVNCLPPKELRFKVLITTRQKWLTQSFERLELKVLDKDSALELLMSYVEHSRIEAEQKEAEGLCEDLGFLPLGLELVARYLERKPNLSLAKTRERLRLKHKSLDRFSKDMTAQRGVVAAFELSWYELDEDSQELGCLFSLFASAPTPWDLVDKCLSDVDEEDLEDRRDKLINFSLLQDLGGSNYGLHPLIRQYFRNKFAGFSSFVEEMKYSICKVIAESAREIPDTITVQKVSEVEVYIPHIVEVAENLHEFLSDDDLITPFVRLGMFYKGQGLYSQAQPWDETGKEMAEQQFGEEHPSVANTLNNLAVLYRSQGRYEEAKPLYIQALEINKKLLGEEHPSVANTLNNLAHLYHSQGRYEEAKPLYTQSLNMRKKLLGEEHPDVATSLHNLAGLYDSQGRYEEAKPLYIQALEINKKLLGEEHPDVATSLNNLARLYYDQGRYEEAEPLYIQALDMYKKLLGEEHPNIATSLGNLAGLYKSQGRYEEAKSLYTQSLNMRKKLLGEEHPNIATSLNNLAGLYKSQGRYEEAEPLYIKALNMRKKLLGEEHPSFATSLNNLAGLYESQGRYEKAESLTLKALDIYKKLLGEEHPSFATSLNNLAGFYYNQGRYEEAKALYIQALNMRKKLLGEEHPSVANSLNNLALLYKTQGRYTEAEPFYIQALEMYKKLLGEEHPETQIFLENYQIFLNEKNE
jgi:tetratricopeptide (TPR) repeat protein